MGIREYIRQAREERGWSVREAAKRCHISGTRFTEVFETGISRNTGKPTGPSLAIMVRASQGFSIPLQTLLDEAGMTDVSPDEQQESDLIQAWRGLSPTSRTMAVAIVKAMLVQDKNNQPGPRVRRRSPSTRSAGEEA